jgi:hypothetical protein
MADSDSDGLEFDVAALLDHRKRLDELRVNQLTSYDKAVLTLSTGAIALSLLLLQWVSSRHAPEDIYLIAASWVALLVAILANLFSYQTSYEDVTREIAKLDQDILAGRAISEDGNLFRSLTVFLNRLSLGSFAIGSALLFWFAYVNAANSDLDPVYWRFLQWLKIPAALA